MSPKSATRGARVGKSPPLIVAAVSCQTPQQLTGVAEGETGAEAAAHETLATAPGAAVPPLLLVIPLLVRVPLAGRVALVRIPLARVRLTLWVSLTRRRRWVPLARRRSRVPLARVGRLSLIPRPVRRSLTLSLEVAVGVGRADPAGLRYEGRSAVGSGPLVVDGLWRPRRRPLRVVGRLGLVVGAHGDWLSAASGDGSPAGQVRSAEAAACSGQVWLLSDQDAT